MSTMHNDHVLKYLNRRSQMGGENLIEMLDPVYMEKGIKKEEYAYYFISSNSLAYSLSDDSYYEFNVHIKCFQC